MRKNLTEIIFVIDESGSMGDVRDDIIGGFNTFINDQKKVEGEALVTITKFNQEYQIINKGTDINSIKPLNEERYSPGGMTALLDAVGRTIDSVHKRHEHSIEDKPEKVIFVVMTDGHENASKEYTKEQVAKKVKEQKEKYDWEFVFTGADIDSFGAGGSIGVASASTMNFSKSSKGIGATFASLSNNATMYRSGNSVNMAFSSSDYNVQANLGVDNSAKDVAKED